MKKKMRGPRRVWKGLYLDPKGALGGPQKVPQVAPSGPLGASIGVLAGLIVNLREPYQGL
jgi:hypothetical protein